MGTETGRGWTTVLLLLFGAASSVGLTASLNTLQTYSVGSGVSQNARWFPDGKRALIAVDNTVVVTDDNGKALQTLWGPVHNVSELAIRPDGMQVAAVASGELFVWQLAGGRLLQRLKVPGTEVELAQFRADGRLLIRLVGAQKLQLLEVGQTRPMTTEVPSGYFVVSPNGKSLLNYEYAKETATLLDAATLQPLGPARVIKQIGWVAASADSRRFVASSDLNRGGTLTVFSAGQVPRAIPADLQGVSLTFVGPDEVLTLALGEGGGGRAQTVNVQAGKAQAVVLVKGALSSLKGNQSGRLIFTGDGQARLTQWAGGSWNMPKVLNFPAGRVVGVGFDGPQPLALVGSDLLRLGQAGKPMQSDMGTDIKEASLRGGSLAGELDESTRKVLAGVSLPQGATSKALTTNAAGTVALGVNLRTSGTGEVWVYPRGSSAPRLKIKAAGAPMALAFSPDSRWLAVSTNSVKTGVQIFDLGSGAEAARSVPLNLFAGGLVWNADGKLLVGRGVVGKASSVTLLQFKP